MPRNDTLKLELVRAAEQGIIGAESIDADVEIQPISDLQFQVVTKVEGKPRRFFTVTVREAL